MRRVRSVGNSERIKHTDSYRIAKHVPNCYSLKWEAARA